MSHHQVCNQRLVGRLPGWPSVLCLVARAQAERYVVSCFHPSHKSLEQWQRLLKVLEFQGNVHIWLNSWNLYWRPAQKAGIFVQTLLLWHPGLDMYFSEHAKSSLVNEKDPKLSVCQRGSADPWQYVKWSQALHGQTCKHFSFLESLHYTQKIIILPNTWCNIINWLEWA